MLSSEIRLVTDFNDYYDELCNDAGKVPYVRKYKNCMSKAEALRYLTNFGTPVIETKPVTKFNSFDRKLVVYTDPYAHCGKGKIICSYGEAVTSYPNYLASPYIEGTEGVSLKFLQVGSRRFRIMMKNNNFDNFVKPGIVTQIDELSPAFNYAISLPIFSIDYISCGNEMIAVDFNEVQDLSRLGFEDIMKPEEVIHEIEKSFNHKK